MKKLVGLLGFFLLAGGSSGELPKVYQIASCNNERSVCSIGSALVIGPDRSEEGAWLALTAKHLFDRGSPEDCVFYDPESGQRVKCQLIEAGSVGEEVERDWAVVKVRGQVFKPARVCKDVLAIWSEPALVIGYPGGKRLKVLKAKVVDFSAAVYTCQLEGALDEVTGLSGGAIYLTIPQCVAAVVVGYFDLPCGHKVIVGIPLGGQRR